MLIRTCC